MYLCQVCGLSFAKLRLKLNHQRLHNFTKKFQCPKCGKYLSRMSTYKKHFANFHGQLLHLPTPQTVIIQSGESTLDYDNDCKPPIETTFSEKYPTKSLTDADNLQMETDFNPTSDFEWSDEFLFDLADPCVERLPELTHEDVNDILQYLGNF